MFDPTNSMNRKRVLGFDPQVEPLGKETVQTRRDGSLPPLFVAIAGAGITPSLSEVYRSIQQHLHVLFSRRGETPAEFEERRKATVAPEFASSQRADEQPLPHVYRVGDTVILDGETNPESPIRQYRGCTATIIILSTPVLFRIVFSDGAEFWASPGMVRPKLDQAPEVDLSF